MHNIASSFHRHTCRLEFKMSLPPVKKQKTLAYIRKIQVYKRWTKVYSHKGLTAMAYYLESNRGILSGVSEGVSLGGAP